MACVLRPLMLCSKGKGIPLEDHPCNARSGDRARHALNRRCCPYLGVSALMGAAVIGAGGLLALLALAILVPVVFTLARFALIPFDFVGDVACYIARPRHRFALHEWLWTIKESFKRAGTDRIVLLAHSLGSVAAAQALKRPSSTGQDSTVSLVTFGSPLLVLSEVFPATVETPAKLAEVLRRGEVALWANLWRTSDVIGRALLSSTSTDYADVALGSGGHVHYWKDPRACEWIVRHAILGETPPIESPIGGSTSKRIRVALSTRFGVAFGLLAAILGLGLGLLFTGEVVVLLRSYVPVAWESFSTAWNRLAAPRQLGQWDWVKLIIGWSLFAFLGALGVAAENSASVLRLVGGLAGTAVAVWFGWLGGPRAVPCAALGLTSIAYVIKQVFGLCGGHIVGVTASVRVDHGDPPRRLTLRLPDGTCKEVDVQSFGTKATISIVKFRVPCGVSCVHVSSRGFEDVAWNVAYELNTLTLNRTAVPNDSGELV